MIDAQTVSGSEILGSTVRPDRDYRVKVYDFKRPDKFSAAQIHTVQLMHETVARLAVPLFSQIMGDTVDVQCTHVDQLAYYEFIESIPAVAALVPLSVKPLKGPMLLGIDGELARRLAHAACGAHGDPSREQPLSEMECVVLKDVIDHITPFFDEAWHAVIPVTTVATAVETDPQYMQIVPPTEMIVLVSLEVRAGDARGLINVVMPFLTIEPVVPRLDPIWWFSQVHGTGGPRVAARAAEAPVDVSLVADTVSVSLRNLPAVLDGEPLEVPGLAEGGLLVVAGGVPVAEVRCDAARLADDDPLNVEVASCHVSAPEELQAAEERVSMPFLLSNAVESLTSHIREVKSAIEELREDRDSMLVDADGSSDETSAAIDQRYHRDVALVLAPEPPEIVAFVLAGLQPEFAAAVLADLSEDVQADIVRCISAMQDGDRVLHRKLVSHISRRISRAAETTTNGGDEVAAGILNLAPRSLEKRVMEGFMKSDKALFERIARLMFVFGDFVLVDSRAIQKLASRVSVEELALAMKGVQEEVASHITSALDEKTVTSLREAEYTLGPVRRRDVEAAQRDMIEELRQLEKSGEVIVARPDEVVE